MKAMRALTRYATAGIEETGLRPLGFSPCWNRLSRQGPLPVNTIGPNRGSDPGLDQYRSSIASSGRAWSAASRAPKTDAFESLPSPHVATLIVSAFRKHSGQMKKVFSELGPEELRGLEVKLKKVGKRAAALMEKH